MWRSATEVFVNTVLGGGALGRAESGVEEKGRLWVGRGGCEVTWKSATEVRLRRKGRLWVGRGGCEVTWRSATEVHVNTAVGGGALGCAESGSRGRETVLDWRGS